MTLPEGWTPHDGVECPVPLDSRPLMMFRTQWGIWDASYAIQRNRKWRARNAIWTNCIAYRPENPHA